MPNPAEVYEEQEDIVQLALDNFAALLDDVDFSGELASLGIGRLQFLRRRQMLIELRGLYMALWRLALGRSFPHDADAMFSVFIHGFLMRNRDKIARAIAERGRQYWGMLEPVGDSDFTDVARHLISFSAHEEKDRPALVLRLALDIRSIYRTIFERLI